MNPLGLVKKIRKKAKKTVKKVGEKVGVDKTIKSAVKGGRKLYSATAPFNPALLGAGSFLQPGQLGIKNKANQRLFDMSQKGTRIVGGALLGGTLASGAAPGAGTSVIGGLKAAHGATGATAAAMDAGAAGGGSFFSGLGGLGTAKGLLAGGAILAPMLQGKPENPNRSAGGPMNMSAGDFSWNPSGGGGNFTAGQGLTYNTGGGYGLDLPSSYGSGSPESLQLAYLQQMMQSGGLTPELRAQRKNRAVQDIRSAQADRGMFNSGLALRQEAEMMPEIESQLDDVDFSRYGTMFNMLDPMGQRRFQSGMADKEMAFQAGQADLERRYGLQRDRNKYLFGGSAQEDEQDFLARMNYQDQQSKMWQNIGAAGANYFLS